MIIPIPCSRFIIPEFTKPTTITVVAEELCITAVTPAPNKIPLSGVEVSLSSILSNLPPDIFSNPSPNTFIPYKKNANPVINPKNISKPSIFTNVS